MIEPLYALAGALVGILVGMTGVGGGSLMTPLLVLVFNFHPATAVGTDLLYAATTKAVGSGVHGRRGTVDWRIVGLLAMGSVPASAATLLALSHYGEMSKSTGHAITAVLGFTLIATALAVFLRNQIVLFARNRFGTRENQNRLVSTTILGAILGVLVSISSVGAGAIGVTALMILYPHLPVNRIVGTDIAHAVPLTLVAGLGHWWLGTVDFALLINLLTGSIPGVILGSMIGSRASDRILRPTLGVVLLVVGSKLLGAF